MLHFVALFTLAAAVACTETRVSIPDQPTLAFSVFFNNDTLTGGTTVCDSVFPVPRSGPPTTNLAYASLEALFIGPTVEERAMGYRSFFSERTSDLLKRVRIIDRTAYVDLLDLRRELAGATSSCGSAEFLSQIQRTLEEVPGIDRVILAIDGAPALFYDWMEMECNQSNDNCDPTHFASP
jgi:spore germination protein GerM